MEDTKTAEEKLHDAEKMLENSMRIIGILTHRAGGEIVVSEHEMLAADYGMQTSLDVLTGALTIRTRQSDTPPHM
jgi:hypothetical protein